MNNIFANPADSAANPKYPKYPAINANIKNIKAQSNNIRFLFLKVGFIFIKDKETKKNCNFLNLLHAIFC